jgi:hypothetical protein
MMIASSSLELEESRLKEKSVMVARGGIINTADSKRRPTVVETEELQH